MSSIEDKVCEKIQKRSEVGKSKYGVTMERTDLSTIEWLTHLQEELMDAAVYVERLLGDLSAAIEAMQKEEPVEESHGFSEICMDCGSLTCTC
tara:strand:+ start:163 stop:441 length:279 start_codon:yes stop_codon:yes gene_type:complete